MKKVSLSLICGFAAMIATIVLYFVILSNVLLEAIHLISLVAILLAEGVTTFYAWFAKGSPRKVAAAIVSGVMIPVSMVLSFVYIISFPKGYGTYFGLYFAGMVIANTISLILIFFDSDKKNENDQTQAAKQNMLQLRKMVKCVMAKETAKPYNAQLRALEEKLHFTNDSAIALEDEEIRQMLQQLEQSIADPDFDTEGMLAKLEATIAKRTIINA